MDAPAPAGNHSEVPIRASRPLWQQNRVFCALHTLHLRERLVETESALFYVSLFVGDGLLMTLCHPGQGLPRRDWRGLRRS
jgi:hypothetical protein